MSYDKKNANTTCVCDTFVTRVLIYLQAGSFNPSRMTWICVTRKWRFCLMYNYNLVSFGRVIYKRSKIKSTVFTIFEKLSTPD